MATNTENKEQQQQQQQQQLVVSLTDPSSSSTSSSSTTPSVSTSSGITSPVRVGGKASSLAKLFSIKGLSSSSASSFSVVPQAFALTVDFFQPWIEDIKKGTTFPELVRTLSSQTNNKDDEEPDVTRAIALCTTLKEESQHVPLSSEQTTAIQFLVNAMSPMDTPNTPNRMMLAVRSSAPEEDGTGASFAGAFETKLGIAANFDALTQAIRDCFASVWDYRVFHYKHLNCTTNDDDSGDSTAIFTNIGFAVVVMEMIDSIVAGVAFSANPLNSDRDELVIDSVRSKIEYIDMCITWKRCMYKSIKRDAIFPPVSLWTQMKHCITLHYIASNDIHHTTL